ncbi:hypothetical protein [Streptomyces sp. NPDC021356]
MESRQVAIDVLRATEQQEFFRRLGIDDLLIAAPATTEETR